MANLYKFMGADIVDKLMMDEKHIGIKFSHLHEYNDPYEFFLQLILIAVQMSLHFIMK